jgi:predicted enzyme related to lactoylglutathione lyase
VRKETDKVPDLRLNLLVLKTQQLDKLKGFYSSLGIQFVPERHGDGPQHHAGRVGELVLELYPLPEGGLADATTRLGFVVPNVDAALHSLESAGGTVATKPRRTEWGYRAVVRDPDGRAVESCEQG